MPRRKKTEERRALEFAWMLAGLGLAAAAFATWRHHPVRAAYAGAGGAAALAIAFLARRAWLAVFRAWMKLAEGLAWVSTRVILTIFYFVILTPFALVRRIAGKPTLDTAWHDGKTTYWVPRDPVDPSIERYSKRY
jgi:hypothetical protein